MGGMNLQIAMIGLLFHVFQGGHMGLPQYLARVKLELSFNIEVGERFF